MWSMKSSEEIKTKPRPTACSTGQEEMLVTEMVNIQREDVMARKTRNLGLAMLGFRRQFVNQIEISDRWSREIWDWMTGAT